MKRKDIKPKTKVFTNKSIELRLILMKYLATRLIDQVIDFIQVTKVNQLSKLLLKSKEQSKPKNTKKQGLKSKNQLEPKILKNKTPDQII